MGGSPGVIERSLARLLVPEADLRLERLHAKEAMNAPFEFIVEALSREPALDFEKLLGRPAAIELERPQRLVADQRYFHGHIAAIEQSGSRGRFHHYTLVLRPWLWFLSRTRDCRIFQELSTPEIVAKVFQDHAGIARYETQLAGRYAKRRYCVQYRETDLAFVARLLEEDGIAYHFVHTAESHTLVLTDPGTKRESIPGCEQLRRHEADGRALGGQDVVSMWRLQREVRPGSIVLADFDFKKPNVPVGGRSTEPRTHDLAQAEVFDYPGRFYNDRATEGEVSDGDALGAARARCALECEEAAHLVHAGTTNARGLAVGHVFTLTGSTRADQNREYLVTTTETELCMTGYEAGGIDPNAAGESDPTTPGARFETRFHALPAATPYRPRRTTPKPGIGGPQTATVVGPADEEIHTDAFGRVKLRFHWDRNPDGVPTQDLTAWVRVSEPWAGKSWGGTFLPRVGQEVLVDFLEGDPDRPVVTGRLFNAAQHRTAFSAAGSLPGNKTLSGLRSKEYRGEAYNELLFDDTTGELRTKLSSESGKTQLNLGYLVHPRSDTTAAARGEGFELRTDDWGAVRAAKGLLLTTDGRHRAVGGSLDRNELVACLEEALKLAKGLADQAADASADRADAAPREALGKAVKEWGTGSNAERDAQGAGGQPLIAVSAPGGIALGTPANLTATSGANTDLVAQKNQQLTSGLQTHLHAGTGLRLFAHSGGVKVIANQGKLLAQAQHDDIVANAEKNVDVTATTGHVLVQAEQHVTLVESGGAYIKLSSGAIELGCPGAFTVKAASYSFVGPASGKTVLPGFAASDVGRAFQAVFKGSEQTAADVPFKLTATDGTRIEGRTDDDGRTPKIEQPTYEVLGFVHTPDMEDE